MKKLFLFFSVSLLFLFYFVSPPKVSAQLAITEVFADTQAAQDASEWLEIYNYSPVDIPIEFIKINDKSITANSNLIPAGQFFTVTKNIAAYIEEFGVNSALGQAQISLTNTSSKVDLKFLDQTIHSVSYSNTQPAKSWQLSGFTCNVGIWQNHTNNSANINYDPACNILQTETSDLEINYDLDSEQINFTQPAKKLFGFSADNYFYFGNNYSIEKNSVLIGYYFENHKMLQSLPLVVNVLQQSSTSSSLTSSSSTISSSLSSSVSSIATSSLNSTTSQQSSLSSQQSTGSASVSASSTASVSSQFSTNTSSQSSTNNTSTNNSEITSTQTSSSQIINYTLEISEVYAAPASSEKEWLEIYNYGSQNINLNSCEIRDNTSKHLLNGEILKNSFLQVSDLKISLNNNGELLELYCGNNLVNSWLQPAVKQAEATARRFSNNRHESEIFLALNPTPASQNQITNNVSSSQSQNSLELNEQNSNLTEAKTSSKSISSKNSIVSANSMLGKADGTLPESTLGKENNLNQKETFNIFDYTFTSSKSYQQEAIALVAAALLGVFAQLVLFLNAIFRNENLKNSLIEKLKFMLAQVKKQFSNTKTKY